MLVLMPDYTVCGKMHFLATNLLIQINAYVHNTFESPI